MDNLNPITLSGNKCLKTGLYVKVGSTTYRADLHRGSHVFNPSLKEGGKLVLDSAIELVINYNVTPVEYPCEPELVIDYDEMIACTFLEMKGVILVLSIYCTITQDLLEYIQKWNPAVQAEHFKEVME